MKRSVLLAVPAVVVVLGVGALVAPSFMDWNQYKPRIQQEVKTATGHTIELKGPVSLAILPTPRVSIADVSVAAPAGSKSDHLIQLSRADVHLALMPLFSGKVEFTSVTLVKPDIALEKGADGKGNWETPEILAMQEKKEGGSAKQQDIALNKIEIKEGAFRFSDASKGNAAPFVAENINVEASADTLKGPFDAAGDVTVSGQKIDFDVETEVMAANGELPIKAKGNVNPTNASFDYNGIVTTSGMFQAQGQADVRIADVLGLGGKGGAKGLVTANENAVVVKGGTYTIAGGDFTGDLSVEMKTKTIAADLKSKDTISIDKFVNGSANKDKKAAQGLLPESLSLPSDFEAGVKLAAPAISYQGKTFENVKLLFTKKDNIFAADVTAAGIPGKGNIDATAAVNFADKATTQQGGVVFTKPELKAKVKGASQNLRETAEALSGQKLEQLDKWKNAAIDGNIGVAGDVVTFRDTTITLGDTPFNVAGSYALNAGNIDMSVSGQAKDAKSLAAAAGMDVKAVPPALESAAIAVAAKGTRNKVNVDVAVKAMGGSVTGKAVVDDPFGKHTMSGFAVEAAHPNTAEMLQQFSPGSARYTSMEKPLSFFADIVPDGKTYHLKNMKANIAGTPMTGAVSIDTGAAKPTVNGDVAFKNLNIQSAAAKGGAQGGPRWSSTPMNTAWMKAYESDFKVTANAITYNNWVLEKPILNVALHNGTLDVKQLDASIFGGEMKMSANMQSAANNQGYSSVVTNASFRSVSMEKMMTAIAGNRIIQASGDVDFDARLNTAGASASALVNGLTGNATTAGRTLVLQGFDLSKFAQTLGASAKPGERLAGLWQSTAKGGSTAFDKMDGAFTITRGIVNIDKLLMEGKTTDLNTSGTVSLPAWTLATAHVITFKDQPEIAPYTIKMSGSLSNPAQSLGQGVLSGVINEQLGNKFQDLLGDKLGEKLGFGKKEAVKKVVPAVAPAAATSSTSTTSAAAPAAAESAAKQAVAPETAPAADEGAAAATTEPAAAETAPAAETPAAVPAETPAAAPAAEPAPAAEEKTSEEAGKEALEGLIEGVMGGN